MDLLSIPAKHPFLLLLLLLSLSLDRISYIIPGLFCNTKSLTGSQMLSRKRSLQRHSFGRQRRFPASCSSSLARSKSTKQSSKRRGRRRRKATNKKQQQQNKTKQNRTNVGNKNAALIVI
jgi:hypothetical protein